MRFPLWICIVYCYMSILIRKDLGFAFRLELWYSFSS